MIRVLLLLFMLTVLLGSAALVVAANQEPTRSYLSQVARALDRLVAPTPLGPDRFVTPSPDPRNEGAACLERLATIKGLRFSKRDAFSNQQGCGARFPVVVKAVGSTEIGGNGALLSCAAAERLAKWIARDVKTILEQHDKAGITRVRHMGSYNCRKIGDSNRWSQHAFANALDIGGFNFADGQSLSIEEDWDSEPVLKALARSACRRFNVVLSPDYNDAHHDHLHLDQGAYKTCR